MLESDGSIRVRAYVAGSIANSLGNQHWRVEWKEWLESLGIDAVDPLIDRGAYVTGRTANPCNTAYIVSKDRLLLESCQVLLIVNDLETFSVGTWVELAWAWEKGLYTILFVTDPYYTSRDMVENAFLQRMCDTIICSGKEELRQLLESFFKFERKMLI